MLTFVPGTLADPSGTAAVTGNPALTMSLAVTGSHSFGDMAPGENINSSANSVIAHVATNAPWSIGVSDVLGTKPAGTEGRMAEYNTVTSSWVPGGKVLADQFNVGANADNWVPLTATSQPLFSGNAGTFDKYPFFKQTIETADTRVASGHSYRIVTTFTASAT